MKFKILLFKFEWDIIDTHRKGNYHKLINCRETFCEKFDAKHEKILVASERLII